MRFNITFWLIHQFRLVQLKLARNQVSPLFDVYIVFFVYFFLRFDEWKSFNENKVLWTINPNFIDKAKEKYDYNEDELKKFIKDINFTETQYICDNEIRVNIFVTQRKK